MTDQTTSIPDYEKVEEGPFVRNNKIFAGILFCLQIFMIVMYAVFIRPTAQQSQYAVLLAAGPPATYSITDGLDNGMFTAAGVGLLVLVGFGLYFSYVRNNLWSGLGFNFLITVIVFQFYFLVNAFWTKAHVQNSDNAFSDSLYIKTYLSDENTAETYGNTAVGAFKCALSMCIAFAAIGGRAGPLEALFISIFGTITYELNRQILTLFSVNMGGSITIFEFGGFMGATIAILLRLTKQSGGALNIHKEYVSHKFNITIALLGAAFCWVFFPVLNMDIPINYFLYSNAGISVLYCISATVLTSVAFSLILNGKIEYRDLITAPIAGGVIIGSSSVYIYNPLESLLFGTAAGILQVLFNKLQKKLGDHPFWSNGVLFLFGVQGLIGGLFSAVMRAINQTAGNYATAYNSIANSRYVYDQRGQISATFITLGISILTGLVVFLLISLVNSQAQDDYYHDKTYWIMNDDGLSNKHEVSVQDPGMSQGEQKDVNYL